MLSNKRKKFLAFFNNILPAYIFCPANAQRAILPFFKVLGKQEMMVTTTLRQFAKEKLKEVRIKSADPEEDG